MGHLMLRAMSRVALLIDSIQEYHDHHRYRQVFQLRQRLRLHDGTKDVFVHISAVERAGLATLAENQRLTFEVETGKNGKVAAVNLKAL